jgi:preprotein translocase subunit SecG
MQSLALVIHVVLAVGVIGLVLIQHGKGADAGAAFGSGASATVFGARGSASFLTRATTVLVALFFTTSIFLFYLAAHREGGIQSVTDVPGLVEEAPAPSTDLPGGVTEVPAATGSETDLPKPAQ